MAEEPTRSGWRPRFYEVSGALLGLVMGGAFLASGQVGTAIFTVVLLTAFGVFLARGRSDIAVIGTDRADERQKRINLDAVNASYLAVITVALIGGIAEIANGHFGPYATVCAVGGGTQLLATVLLSRRR